MYFFCVIILVRHVLDMLIKPAAPKQDHVLKQLPSKLSFYIDEYCDCFKTETSNSLDLGQAYIQGLFKTWPIPSIARCGVCVVRA
jgi:hypothetical protein